MIKKHIPNSVTCLNLISGCVAIILALKGQLELASLFIVLAAIFDFFDGLLARMLKVSSNIGKDLDSLADVVSFGVAPSMMLFYYLSQYQWGEYFIWVPYTAFIMAAFSALRLAKFNNDTRQTTSFIGLPTPANALFWISIILYFFETANGIYGLVEMIVLIVLMLMFSGLLVSEIQMPSFKNIRKNLNTREFLPIPVAIGIGLGMAYSMGIGCIACAILAYVTCSISVKKIK